MRNELTERRVWLRAAHTPPIGEFFEQIIRAIYTAILQPGDLAVDCGANMGVHTLPMSELVGPSGRVLAIEANPNLAKALELRARGSGFTNVDVVPKAVGVCEGRSTFALVQDAPAYSGLRQRDDLPSGLDGSVVEIEVPITTLNNLLAEMRKRARFVKLDLEGGEYHALQGAVSVLKDHRPLVVFENGRAGAARLYGYTRDDWFALFNKTDFAVFDLFGRPFVSELWTFPDMPWYFIAAARGSDDEKFVHGNLGELIRTTHRVWRTKHRINQWITQSMRR